MRSNSNHVNIQSKNKLQVASLFFVVTVGIISGLVWVSGDTPSHISSTSKVATVNPVDLDQHQPSNNIENITSTASAAVLDAETLRQRVVGKWLETGEVNTANELSTSLDHHLADTQKLLGRLQGNITGNSSRHLQQQLVSKQAEFLTLQVEVERWLSERDMQDSEQAKKIAQRFEQLKLVLTAVTSATGSSLAQAIVAAQQTLQRLHPPRIGVRGESQPTVTQGMPTTLTPDDFPTAPPPAYVSPEVSPIALIQSNNKLTPEIKQLEALNNSFGENLVNVLSRSIGISTAHADPIHPAASEAASCGFNPADVASALPEVDVTDPDIQALAEQLQHSPLKIYAWLKNNIEFQPYFGSMKGALGTLKSGSGNATDQASLLIALMRVSGLPARYVMGIIHLSDDLRLRNWLGTKTSSAAQLRLKATQVPSVYITDTSDVQLIHVWTEVCVPYDNYRGSGGNNSGFNWIPLDPSFKEMTYTDGTTVADIPGFSFDYTSYLSTRTTVMPHEALRDQMETALGRSLDFGGGYRGTIVQKGIDILPSTLPYEVRAFIAWPGTTTSDIAALPSAHRVQVEFVINKVKLASNGDPLLDSNDNLVYEQLLSPLSIDMPTLVTRRLTLSFKGATVDDQTWIDTTWDGEGKPCLVSNVEAVFRLEGVDVTPAGTRGAVDFCRVDNRLNITIRRDSETYNSKSFTNIGGHNYHALQTYAFQGSERLIEERAAKLLASIAANPDDTILKDDTLGEYLHLVGFKFMDYITSSAKEIGVLHGSTVDSGNHIGLTATAMKVSYVFDLPFAVSRGGLLIDVPGGLFGPRNIIDGSNDYDSFLLDGYAASAYESYIWQEHANLDAVSSVRGIQFANDMGIPVVILTTSAEVDTKLNQSCLSSPDDLNYSVNQINVLKALLTDGYKKTISDGTNTAQYTDGYTKITLPACRIQYEDWLGAVWVAEYNKEVGILDGYILSEDTLTLTEEQILTKISNPINYTISGGYVLGGGYTLSTPPSLTFDLSLNTGFQNQIDESVYQSLSNDLNSSTTINTPNLGNGSGQGNTPNTSSSGDPVNLVSGNMYIQEADITLKGLGGLNIVFERFYNSHARKDGPLGYGWTNHYLKFFDVDSNGDSDNLTSQVFWVDGTASTSNFTVVGDATGVPLSTTLINPKGINVTATREANGEYSIKEKNGLTFYFENVAGSPDTTAKLIRVVDKNGNTLRFAYSGNNLQTVTDDLSRNLTFYYDDGNAHITRVVDWVDRTYRYNYDTSNNLASYEPPLAVAGIEASTTYTYYLAADGQNLDHAMESFTKPNGDTMTFEYYTNGKVFRHTNSHGKSFTFRYNTFRRETTTVNERGISQTYLFNEWGQQLQHVQGDGSRRTYEYNDTDNPLNETTVRHALGYETLHEYDSTDGDLKKSTLPDGSTLEYYGKNAFHQYCTVIDAASNYSLSRYDANGNRTQSIALKKGVVLTKDQAKDCNYVPPATDILAWTINTYNTNGDLLTSKRVRDFVTQTGPYIEYFYDAKGLNPTTVKRCGMQHDNNDNLVSYCVNGTQVFDSLGRMTIGVGADFYEFGIEYDTNGRIARKTDTLGEWRDFSYDDSGNLVRTHLLGMGSDGKMGMQVYNTIEYDTLNRPTSTKNKAGFTSRTEYDEIGNILQVTNPDGYSIRFEYDGMNRPTRAFDEQGHEVKTDYDIGGRPITTTDPNGNATQYEYYGAEENGRLKLVTTPDSRTLQYFYDNNGNVIRTLDNTARENLTDFDSLNRPVRTVGSVHNSYGMLSIRQVTVTEYNNLGFVTKIRAGYTADTSGAVGSDVLADQAIYAYDDFGRQITATDANGKVTKSFYDTHGNLKRTESPNGHIVSYSYDDTRNGLLTTQTAKLSASDPTPHITRYEYNVLGQMTQVIAPEVTYTYGYDEANRLTTITDSRGSKVLTYDYSPGGLLNSVADSDGKRTDFLYDAASRLTAMLAANGDRVNFIFDAGGRLRETSIPNGLKAQYKYDAGNNLLSLKNSTSAGIVSQHDYTYDAVGRRATHLENIAGTSTDYQYSYDNLDRVTDVKKDSGTTLVEQYSYDPYNNRRTRTPNGGNTYFYQYDAAQQLNQILTGSDTGTQAASFTYDDKGNLTFKSEGGVTRTFTYNALDRLSQVAGNDISTETYTYDHQGRRIEKNVGGAINRYTYSGMSIWAEFGATWGDALAYYNYTGVDKAVIRSTPNTADTRYYHNDGLGSAVAVTNAAGATQASTRYDSWGTVIAGGGVPQFGFTGREPDATGLMYFRARYYDPGMGRFTQRDPIGFAGGLNPYTYVNNSPQNFTDPLGLAQAAVSVGGSQGSSYAGNFTTASAQGTTFTGQNAVLSAQSAECLSCHGIDSSQFTGNFPSDSEQRAGAAFVLGAAATLPASGAVAAVSVGGRAIGWAVSAMNSGRAAVTLGADLAVTSLPVITRPVVQESALAFSTSMFPGAPVISGASLVIPAAGVAGFAIGSAIPPHELLR